METKVINKLNSTTLSSSLRQLADALDQLADVIEKQKTVDNETHVKQLSVIVKRFSDKTAVLSQPTELDITAKYKKGFLKQYLQQRNIQSAKYLENLKADAYLNDAAHYMMQHYEHLKEFYKQLKKRQYLRQNFTFKTNAQALQFINNWCKLLHSNKIIDHYRMASANTVFVDVSEVHQAALFILGYWLEVLLRSKVAAFLKKNIAAIAQFDILSQMEIAKPDGTVSELDLMLMLNGNVFWFECKSGQIGGDYMHLFAHHRQLLQLDSQHSFLMIPEPNVKVVSNLQKQSGMTVLFATEADEQIHRFLSSALL